MKKNFFFKRNDWFVEKKNNGISLNLFSKTNDYNAGEKICF